MLISPDSRSDRIARFGCGALVGLVLVVGTLLGQGFYRFLEGPLNRSLLFVWTFALGMPAALGTLSVVLGWQLPEKLAEWLLNLPPPK
jgi:hypothetical protein